jgi:hypothetical protein
MCRLISTKREWGRVCTRGRTASGSFLDLTTVDSRTSFLESTCVVISKVKLPLLSFKGHSKAPQTKDKSGQASAQFGCRATERRWRATWGTSERRQPWHRAHKATRESFCACVPGCGNFRAAASQECEFVLEFVRPIERPCLSSI